MRLEDWPRQALAALFAAVDASLPVGYRVARRGSDSLAQCQRFAGPRVSFVATDLALARGSETLYTTVRSTSTRPITMTTASCSAQLRPQDRETMHTSTLIYCRRLSSRRTDVSHYDSQEPMQ
jgi:hypothetical protein